MKGVIWMKKLNLPVGVSDFSEIRENAFYYVDKSELIVELLKDKSTKVTLITRPHARQWSCVCWAAFLISAETAVNCLRDWQLSSMFLYVRSG